jgi:hypothetical protein
MVFSPAVARAPLLRFAPPLDPAARGSQPTREDVLPLSYTAGTFPFCGTGSCRIWSFCACGCASTVGDGLNNPQYDSTICSSFITLQKSLLVDYQEVMRVHT